jgi:hypothetical protein
VHSEQCTLHVHVQLHVHTSRLVLVRDDDNHILLKVHWLLELDCQAGRPSCLLGPLTRSQGTTRPQGEAPLFLGLIQGPTIPRPILGTVALIRAQLVTH